MHPSRFQIVKNLIQFPSLFEHFILLNDKKFVFLFLKGLPIVYLWFQPEVFIEISLKNYSLSNVH